MKTRSFVTMTTLIAGSLLIVLLMATLLLLNWLRAAPDEWSQSTGTTLRVSTTKLLRLATQPRIAALLTPARFTTASGTWRVRAVAQGVELRCAPCLLALPALGAQPLSASQASVYVRRRSADLFEGTLRVGGVALPWIAQLDPSGLSIASAAEHVSLADLVAVLAAGTPEAARVQVRGTLSYSLRLRLPGNELDFQPRLENFSVQGLGTEMLRNVRLPADCGNGTVRGWLPIAVLSAEDQRFWQHPGYDLESVRLAQQANQRGAALQGASTLTQQLAKLIYARDDRSAQRKLRELLYAVEMERTLGKARILQLYLALAPWGEAACGAQRAALLYLRKPASVLDPVEAAWLASLLTNPREQLDCQRAKGYVDARRVARVLEGMRPMAKWRRDAALGSVTLFTPPTLQSVHATVCPQRATLQRLASGR